MVNDDINKLEGQHQLNIEVEAYRKLWTSAINLAKLDLKDSKDLENMNSAKDFLEDKEIQRIGELLDIKMD